MPDTQLSFQNAFLFSEPIFSCNGNGHKAENDAARRLLRWLEQVELPLQTLLAPGANPRGKRCCDPLGKPLATAFP